MNMTRYFPEGVAQGEAFVNRVEERKQLINRIKANKHSVLIAPRRYGKTSLVLQVANEMKIPYCSMDLLAAYSAEYVRDQIVDKVGRLVVELTPSFNKSKEIVINIFKQMKPEISLGAFGQRLTLSMSKNPLQDITELLLKLDETAEHFDKRAVIFIDEFQQISQLKHYHSIEASIRHAVERSQRISYVFSGSNRQLLQQMFGEQGRPLYRLCQTMNIERMSQPDYIEHLQQFAKLKWKKSLPNEILQQIFFCTELHPFYMNVLCQMLWEKDNLASADEVGKIWHDYVKAQKHIIAHDIVELSVNQRKVMSALAKMPAKEIQSTEFLIPLKLSASSAQQAIEVLLRKDLIYKNTEGLFTILDPAMRFYLDTVIWENI